MDEQCRGVPRHVVQGRAAAIVAARLGFLALTLAAAVPSRSATPPQTWAGGYQLNGHHSSLSLSVSGSGESPSIKANMLIKGVSDVPLTDVSWKNGKFRGKLKEGDGTDSFDGRVTGNQIVGVVTKGGSSGPFRLIRLADVGDRQLRSIEGAYRGQRGTYLVERLWVGHWIINMAEERSGEFRGIFPVGPNPT